MQELARQEVRSITLLCDASPKGKMDVADLNYHADSAAVYS